MVVIGLSAHSHGRGFISTFAAEKNGNDTFQRNNPATKNHQHHDSGDRSGGDGTDGLRHRAIGKIKEE